MLIAVAFVPVIIGPLSCFVIYAILSSRDGSERLTASSTFSSLAIISLLSSPASSFLQSLPMVGMSTGCLDRIQKFLLSEPRLDGRNVPIERSHHVDGRAHMESNSIELSSYQQMTMGGLAVSLKNASIQPSADSPIVLHDINSQIEKGTFTMIMGVVGSGKSTLLKAIIGELKCTAGTIEACSRYMAYCSQTPWLPNSTVRQIICDYQGHPAEDEEWYNTVLHACAFDEDVRLLPDSHDTIIGSRGVTLSGGQKQRLVGHFKQ
jgi:ATP-binding cassette, subfamily C (CFTR/MRP), member 1